MRSNAIGGGPLSAFGKGLTLGPLGCSTPAITDSSPTVTGTPNSRCADNFWAHRRPRSRSPATTKTTAIATKDSPASPYATAHFAAKGTWSVSRPFPSVRSQVHNHRIPPDVPADITPSRTILRSASAGSGHVAHRPATSEDLVCFSAKGPNSAPTNPPHTRTGAPRHRPGSSTHSHFVPLTIHTHALALIESP